MAHYEDMNRVSDDERDDIKEETRREVLDQFRAHMTELEDCLMQSRKALGRLETGLADLYQILSKEEWARRARGRIHRLHWRVPTNSIYADSICGLHCMDYEVTSTTEAVTCKSCLAILRRREGGE